MEKENWAVIDKKARFASAGMTREEAEELKDNLGGNSEIVPVEAARELKQAIMTGKESFT